MTKSEKVTPRFLASIDGGNMQAKLIEEKTQKPIVLPSYYAVYNPYLKGLLAEVKGNNIDEMAQYKVPHSKETIVYGTKVAELYPADALIETISTTNRYNTPKWKTYMQVMIARLAYNLTTPKNNEIILDLKISLPTDDAQNDDQLDKIAEFLKENTLELYLNDRKMLVTIGQIEFIEQSEGVIYYLALDKEGSLNKENEKMLNSKVAVLDIGGGTALADMFASTRVIRDGRKTTYPKGVQVLYNDFLKGLPTLNSVFGSLGLKKANAQTIVRNGIDNNDWTFEIHQREGGSINLKEYTQTIIDNYTNELIELLSNENSFGDIQTLSYFIINGGGANVINLDEFKKFVPFAQVSPNPETSTVEGLLRYGLSQRVV
ncbi:MAG: hypothetical protein LBV67_08665 [Streptococcaceae bacterium]|jgi:hypothetical protein|nr:hypothetical protein [Streptococcaceae bacterium]